MRSAEDYVYFTGWYCDDCLDWIDIDEEHWRLFRVMQMVDSRMSHPLSVILWADHVGRTIAAFTLRF